MVEAAKVHTATNSQAIYGSFVSFRYGGACDLNNVEAQESLCRAAEDLRNAMNAAAKDALKRKLIKKLEVAAKQMAVSATQCIAAEVAYEL